MPDEVNAAPPVAVAQLAERLGVDPGMLEEYGRREQTRTDHLRSVAKYPGWKQASPGSSVFMAAVANVVAAFGQPLEQEPFGAVLFQAQRVRERRAGPRPGEREAACPAS
ncbi:MAG TPA: DUF4158 domain-containing protein, partial [Nonomuraea sp.]|nr:DUF4158 domain-containing protein [Nonomuraea sp.]